MPSVTVTVRKKRLDGAAQRAATSGDRRMIDREIARGLEDIKKGRVHGPFTAPEATKFIKSELKARVKNPKPK